MSASRLVVEIDTLYEAVVTDPTSWNEARLAEWSEGVVAEGRIEREDVRELRRALRIAVKLSAFWASRGSDDEHSDWRSRVDLAVGIPAWRPSLALARRSLEAEPSAEAFASVQELFRVVHNQPWLDGVTFAEWSTGHAGEEPRS